MHTIRSKVSKWSFYLFSPVYAPQKYFQKMLAIIISVNFLCGYENPRIILWWVSEPTWPAVRTEYEVWLLCEHSSLVFGSGPWAPEARCPTELPVLYCVTSLLPDLWLPAVQECIENLVFFLQNQLELSLTVFCKHWRGQCSVFSEKLWNNLHATPEWMLQGADTLSPGGHDQWLWDGYSYYFSDLCGSVWVSLRSFGSQRRFDRMNFLKSPLIPHDIWYFFCLYLERP